ncbi:MAG: transposase [Bryobacterales bacterium]|jgi:hypothetical protein|nr:transposase [Bryobacterales bacterium]
MMMDKGQRHLVYAYNAQAAVDGHAQVIVSAKLTQDETDYRILLPMVEAAEQAMGTKPAAVTADADYWDTENINSEALKGMLVLVNLDGGKKRASDEATPRRSNPTMERMRELLKTDEAKAVYKQRKAIVEPVFGQIKQERGIRDFRLRGFTKTKAEWKRIYLTHNLLKLYRHEWLPKRTNTEPGSPIAKENGPKSTPKTVLRAKTPSRCATKSRTARRRPEGLYPLALLSGPLGGHSFRQARNLIPSFPEVSRRRRKKELLPAPTRETTPISETY